MKVRTTTRNTIVTGDGYVSRTTTTITTFSETESHAMTDDGAAVTQAPDAVADGVRAADVTGEGSAAVGDGCPDASGCFDASGCDDTERRLIAALRAYLRPTCAPEPLMARLHACLDRVEDEECRGCGK